jgi:hypothetical protein
MFLYRYNFIYKEHLGNNCLIGSSLPNTIINYEIRKIVKICCDDEQPLASGFCIFHDKDYLQDKTNYGDNKRKLLERLKHKVNHAISNNEPLLCIGFQLHDFSLSDLSISENFIKPAYFSGSQFFWKADFTGAKFQGSACFSEAYFQVQADFSNSEFYLKTYFSFNFFFLCLIQFFLFFI